MLLVVKYSVNFETILYVCYLAIFQSVNVMSDAKHSLNIAIPDDPVVFCPYASSSICLFCMYLCLLVRLAALRLCLNYSL